MADVTSRRAHALLRSAVQLEPGERLAFVQDACHGDATVLASTLALLDALDRSPGFLETPALTARAPSTTANHDRDEAIGGYRIVGVIGAGGMATVYEAMQERPRRRVALKVMKRGLEHTSALHRFQFETEVLARLRHPGIAQIFEAGAHEDRHGSAIPFFAMEYLEGARPITAYADAHRLALAERLRMFAEVCDAVHHGHLNGVIHRDLKPGNVLVDGNGHPKVIDFGIARSSDPAQAWITRQADIGQLVGTLNFMSPEQCAGEAGIDVRTDVYSLGIILYELACGRLPHDLGRVSVPEALRIVQHDSPLRPSAVDPSLRGDVEAMILMAIDKEPARRYASAAALAADVRRHLRHEAIEARPPTLLYQCRLFARRNRSMVAALAAIAVALLAATAVSTTFAVRTNRESKLRQLAETRAITERDAARWQAYIANIAGAFAALHTDEFQQIRSRLARAPAAFRGWEWGFLAGLADPSERTLAAHEDMIFAFAATVDGARLATAARDGSLRVWDAADGRCIADIELAGGDPFASVAFGADGRMLVAGAADGSVRTWDLDGDGSSRLLGKHEGRVLSVACDPSGAIASASADGVAHLWDGESGTRIRTLEDQPGGIHGVAFSQPPAGGAARLLTWNRGGSTWVRDQDGVAVRRRLAFGGDVGAATFDRDGTLLAVGGALGRIVIWRTDTGEIAHELTASTSVSRVRALAFSPTGDRLACGQGQRGIVLWSLGDTPQRRELRGHAEAVSGLAFGGDGDTLFSASWDRTIRTWRLDSDAAPAAVTTLAGHEDHVLGASFSPDGSLLASGSRDGTIRLWDPELGLSLGALGERLGDVFAVEFSPDGRLIASGSDDRTVRLWDAGTGELVAVFDGHEDAVWSVAFDPSGERLASCGSDGTIRIWNVRTGETEQILTGHTQRVISSRFSPDGSLLASSSRDGSVRVWEVATGRLVHELCGHDSDVFAVMFSLDGSELFSGCRDQTVRVWSAATGACTDVLDGHGQFVTCLARSPDGTRLAAGSWFGEIVLWDVATHDLVASFKGHDSPIRSVSFSPDGRWLASGSYDATIRLFDAATPEERTRRQATAVSSRADAMAVVEALLFRTETPEDALRLLEVEDGVESSLLPWVRNLLLERALEARASG